MNKLFKKFLLILFVAVCGLIAWFWGMKATEPQERNFTIQSRKYSYTPERIVVNRGDRVIIKLSSEDVTHGFYLEDHDIDAKIRAEYPHFWLRHPSQGEEYEQVTEISFIAQKSGKFRYRCSITCGTFHPFMQGEMIVKPNSTYSAAIGLVFGLTVALIFYLGWLRD